MTPQERVQKLRDRTAHVEGETWAFSSPYVCPEVEGCTCEGGGDLPHRPTCGLDYPVADTYAIDTGQHIARWDPAAAAKVLDLLGFVFDRHVEAWDYSNTQRPLNICEREPVGWPCGEYRAALAVLDALDGGAS